MNQKQLLKQIRMDLLRAYGQASAFNLLDRNETDAEMIDAIRETGEMLQSNIRNAIAGLTEISKSIPEIDDDPFLIGSDTRLD